MFGDQNVQETEHRINGYRDALNRAGIEFDEECTVVGSYSQHDGYDTMVKWLDRFPDMTAVFCAGDTLAMGALLALYERGFNVPDQFSVVGFDGLPISRYMVPPLTTIAQPTYGKGEKAAAMLIDSIEQNHGETLHINLRPELIIRKSTGPVPSKG
jgi:LacI family transcriptional regulator